MQELTLDEFLQAEQLQPSEHSDAIACPAVLPLPPLKLQRTDNKTQVIYKGKPLKADKDE